MKVAILMNKNSYAGREYLKHLANTELVIDIIQIGDFPLINNREEERCGGLWNPPDLKSFGNRFATFSFDSLRSEALYEFLEKANYDLGIQGGTGILRDNVINHFRLGILNFHPGDLPLYRGCSAPEWQLYEGNSVISTCHLVDKGIDTGRILDKHELALNKESYESFRSTIYPETAKFVTQTVASIVQSGGFIKEPQSQDESKAIYREYIGNDRLRVLQTFFSQ